jgi:hypothetical protein
VHQYVRAADCIRASSRGEHKGLALTFGEDAGSAQLAQQLFVNRWAAAEYEIGPKGPYDQLYKNN